MKTIAVIGGGSWATALMKILLNNNSGIQWWIRKEETVNFIKKYHHNPNYLSDVELDLEKINVSSALKEVLLISDIVILAVPFVNKFFISTLLLLNFCIFKRRPPVFIMRPTCKEIGIEVNGYSWLYW